jgi:hypothetical protein
LISFGEAHFSVEIDKDLTAKIELSQGEDDLNTWAFNKQVKIIKIGRSRNNDIILANSAYSRTQTSLFFDEIEESWFIQDGFGNTMSTNGTW